MIELLPAAGPEGHHGKEEQQADLPVGIGPTSALGFRTGPERPAQEVDVVRKRGLGHRNTSLSTPNLRQIVVWRVSLCSSCLW